MFDVKKATTISSCFLFLFVFANAGSALVFKKIIWQKSVSEKAGPKVRFKTVKTLELEKNKPIPAKLRIIVRIKNTGRKPLKAVIIRCAFYIKLVSLTDKTQKPLEMVPFKIEERRVSIIKPGRTVNIKTTSFPILNYLKRLKDTGFWISEIKAETMVEPKKGDNLTDNITQSAIKVIYD